GLLKGALAPLSRLVAQGTVGQITALSVGARNLPKIRGTGFSLTSRPRTSKATDPNRLLLAQNQRNAALAVQRQASAEKLLSTAEARRASSSAKLAESIKQTTKARFAQNAVLDQNTRSLTAN